MIRLKTEEKSSVTGKSLRSLNTLFKKSIVIGCVIRNGTVLIPEGNTVFESNDEVIILCHKKQIPLVQRWFGAGLGARLKLITDHNPETNL